MKGHERLDDELFILGQIESDMLNSMRGCVSRLFMH